jgi:lysyl-tRNA synthetase class 2
MGFSKNGTRSLVVRHWRMIGKCLRPLPNMWRG